MCFKQFHIKKRATINSLLTYSIPLHGRVKEKGCNKPKKNKIKRINLQDNQ